jgi:hypothetical protein
MGWPQSTRWGAPSSAPLPRKINALEVDESTWNPLIPGIRLETADEDAGPRNGEGVVAAFAPFLDSGLNGETGRKAGERRDGRGPHRRCQHSDQ